MKNRLSTIALALFLSVPAKAEVAKWHVTVSVDDFDDSKTYISAIMSSEQGQVVVRYHESSPAKYEVIWALPKVSFRTCGDSGSWSDHSGWNSIQVRVDGGKVMTLRGAPSVEKTAAFLQDGATDQVVEFLKALKGAKKVVMRTKDKCHHEGQSWIFSKFEDLTGEHLLENIQY